jgi:PEP-CTERM motif-containing protein
MVIRVLSRWLFLLSCTILVLPATTIYDLKTDFNASGVWTFREGDNVLPLVGSWIPGNFSAAQSAYAMANAGTGHVPSWFQASANPLFANTDFQIGDVIVHSASPGVGAANVIWTSQANGSVDLSGGLWMARNIGRANHFDLFLNNTLLTQGNVSDGDAFSRSSPLTFALNDIAVHVGDVIRLQVARTSTFGDFTGVNLTIGVSAVPEPSLAVLALSGLASLAALARFRRRRVQ